MSFIREPDAEPIPGYRLLKPLGSGGFGEVWKCEAPGGLYKAIKFVYGNLNSLDVDATRAEQERRALERIKEVRHPFICSMERIEIVGGELIIVMELADKSLHDLFEECKQAGLVGIPRDDLRRYLWEAAEALDHMNEKHGLQHLDIKPRNLFLISDHCKVADFGLVKYIERQSSSGLMGGGVTPLYAPPETYTGIVSDRSDQYSLAIVYQELLTGQRPFSGKNVRQLAQQHMEAPPDLRALPEAERPIVGRALEKDPAKRFPNCLSFVRALYLARNARPELIRTDLDLPGDGRGKSMYESLIDLQLEEQNGVAGANRAGGKGLAARKPSSAAVPDDEEDAAQLGLTVAQPDTGALRPTLILGVGSFGRRALLELRCRFLDRFGDLTRLPLLRFLYVDSDLEAVQKAVRGAPEVALDRGEVYHLPLQPPGNYRKRMLEHLTEWLPREKLYAIPRGLHTQGHRALGRLAFADNHLRFVTRLRSELQKVSHPDRIYQSVTMTGLALRDNVPRVYVIAAAGGGNSGFLVDLGYAVRRLLQQMNSPESEVTLLLFCGTPGDPATPKAEQANLYATLTELNHFNDAAISFAAQYGVDNARLVDDGPPYHCSYLLQATNRSPETLREVVSHLGCYLFNELTTPLGLRLERSRRAPPGPEATRFRSFGTYAVWYPRGLLLRLAARQAVFRLLEEWMSQEESIAQDEVEAACARTLADPDLRPEMLTAAMEALITQVPENEAKERSRARRSGYFRNADTWLGSSPAEYLTRLLSTLEEQSQQALAEDDPGNWARQALARIHDWLGTSTKRPQEGASSDWQKSRLTRCLSAAADKLAQTWGDRLAQAAFNLMEHPGRRVSTAEAAFARLIQACEDSYQDQDAHLREQAGRTHKAWVQVEAALEACLAGGGGFSFFGNRARRQLRVFMDHLAGYARQRLVEEKIGALCHFFALLRGRLQELSRDLAFCRTRLRNLQEELEAGDEEPPDLAATRQVAETTMNQSPLPSAGRFWEELRQTATAQIVLPDGEEDLEQAAARFLGSLKPEALVQLDQALHDQVLAAQGGLHAACMRAGDLARNLAAPLLDQAVSTLGEHLPITDVAQVALSAAESQGVEIGLQAQEIFERAVPLVVGLDPATQDNFLLVPASEPGKTFGAAAQLEIADLQTVKVPGQAHLMFCREQGYLTLEDLQRLLQPCRPAYDAVVGAPNVSPHARFDILDWVPLDP